MFLRQKNEMTVVLDALNGTVVQFTELVGRQSQILAVAVLAVIVLLVPIGLHRKREDQPPALPELIPYVSNTLQFMTNNVRFLERAS